MATRRKIQIDCRLYETTNESRFKAGSELTAYVYAAGGPSINAASGTGPINLSSISGRTSLEVDDYIYSLGVDNAENSTNSCQITAIEESGSSEGLFSFVVSSTGAFSLDAGGRIVANRSVMDPVPIYKYPTGTTVINGTEGAPTSVDVPENGLIEGYVEVDAVDVYFTGDDITAGWYLFDVPAGSGEIGPLTLREETLAANTVVNVDYHTGVLRLDTDTSAIITIEHCSPGRVLVLSPETSGLQVTTLNSQADNTIYEPTGRTIDLEEGAALVLLGVEASANTAYWVIVGSANVIDLDLGDLSNVTITSASNNATIAWNGSAWIDTTTLGDTTDPLTEVIATTQSIKSSGGAYKCTLTFAGTANKALTVPTSATSGQVVTTEDAQSITGQKTIDDDALLFKDPASNKYARLDAGSVTTGQTRVLTVQDKDYTIADDADIPTNIGDLSDVTITLPGNTSNLRYNGSAWVNSLEVGADSAGHTIYANANGGLNLTDNTGSPRGTLTISADGQLVSDRNLYLDAGLANGSYIVTSDKLIQTAQCQLVRSGNSGGSAGWLTNMVGHSASVNAVPLFYSPNGCFISRVHVMVLREATTGALTGDYELMLYHHTALPTDSTVPPAAGTSILSSNITFPVTAGTDVNTTLTTFADASVEAGRWVFLSVITGSTMPSQELTLFLTVEYTEAQS